MRLLDVITAPWAIPKGNLQQIVEIYQAHMRREKIDLKEIEAQLGRPMKNKAQPLEVHDGVAVIDVSGVLAKRMNLMTMISGGTSMQIAGDQLDQALADDEVRAILLNIDSPGGTVDGTQELAEKIFNARGQKPIVAFADGNMMSAAFWIGMAADQVFISGKNAYIGSVGVIATHVDETRANEQAGIKVTHITSGRFKAVGSPDEPLGETGRSVIQERVDTLMRNFVEDIARFRGVSTEEVREKLGEAQVLIGQQAVESGFVDGVSTLSGLIQQLSESGGDPRAGGDMFNLPERGSAMEKKEQPKASDMSAETLKAEHPEVYEAVKAEAFNEGKQQGLKEGAESERQRIQAVRGSALPGHEALIEQLMFDGQTTGDQAAAKVLTAEKQRLANKSKAHLDDSEAPLEDPAPPAAGSGKPDRSKMPLEERAKAEWEESPKLQDEFAGDFDAYMAYMNADADGRVKVLNSKKKDKVLN